MARGPSDLYEVLGVAQDACAEQIKRAFRTLAVRCHPDKCPGDKDAEERFKTINQAHETLSDPDKRAAYDDVRRMAPSAFAGPPSAPSGFASQQQQRRPKPASAQPQRTASDAQKSRRPHCGYTASSYGGRSRSVPPATAEPGSPLRGRRGADGRSAAAWAEAAAKQQQQQQQQQPPPPPQPPRAPPPSHFSSGCEGDAADALIRRQPYAAPLACTVGDTAVRRLRAAALRRPPDLTSVLRGQQRRVKMVSCGRAGCGKSSLIKRLCEGRFPTTAVPTIGVDFGVWRCAYGGGAQVNFFDLSGDHAFYQIRKEFYEGATAALLVYDCGSRESFDELTGWVREMRLNGLQRGVPVAVVAARTDAAERAVPEHIGRSWATQRGFSHTSACAKTGDGVEAAFAALVCDSLRWGQLPAACEAP